MTGNTLDYLASFKSIQLNLGLCTTRVTAEDLRRAVAEAEDEAPLMDKIEAAVRDLVDPGKIIEWALGLFRSRIAETVRSCAC